MRGNGLLKKFRRDESGSYVAAAALMAPALAGIMGLGVEYGVWVQRHQSIQGAADSAAMSASIAPGNVVTQAHAVAAAYGFSSETPNVTIAVNQPPQSGPYAGHARAVEVVITQLQQRLFSALWNNQPITIAARATAITPDANGCTLTLNKTESAAAGMQGSTRVVLNGCSLFVNSNSASALSVGGSASLFTDSVGVVGGVSGTAGITATQGISVGQGAILDPYANINFPAFSGCTERNYVGKNTETIDPGVYCGGITLHAGAIVTLNPGIYYIDGGDLTVNGGATLIGSGVTFVFTSSSGTKWPTVTINGNATVDVTAPKSGPMQGFVVFADRRIPVGTAFKFNGGSMQYFGGAVYAPTTALSYAGGSISGSTCTQLISDTLSFTGNSNLAVECSQFGTKPIGSTTARIVQ
jgi:Flp pilus assembly protein TadG